MKIDVTDRALDWFKGEMDLVEGEALRFYVRYGGSSPLHDGFRLCITKDVPEESGAQLVRDGRMFYVESADLWFFDGHDLAVDIEPESEELSFSYPNSYPAEKAN